MSRSLLPLIELAASGNVCAALHKRYGPKSLIDVFGKAGSCRTRCRPPLVACRVALAALHDARRPRQAVRLFPSQTDQHQHCPGALTMTASHNNRLCNHDELPSWCKDNAFIISGYRRPGKGPGDSRLDESDDKVLPDANGERGARGDLRQRKVTKRQDRSSNTAHANAYQHDTFARCWHSIWAYTHNETVNIHTHLWGALVSVAILGAHYLHHIDASPAWLEPLAHHAIFTPKILRSSATIENAEHILSRLHLPTSPVLHSPNDWRDTVGFTIFLLCAISCLAFSSTYHTLQCHSHSVARRWNALDYVGIVNMIVGSFLPALHYGFYCRPGWQLFYGSCITVLGAGAMWTVLNAKYATPEYRPYRTAVFLTLGLSAVVPVAHGVALYGARVLNLTMGLNYLVASGALYVAGALLYALRVPERFAPGRFDYFGASHQM